MINNLTNFAKKWKIVRCHWIIHFMFLMHVPVKYWVLISLSGLHLDYYVLRTGHHMLWTGHLGLAPHLFLTPGAPKNTLLFWFCDINLKYPIFNPTPNIVLRTGQALRTGHHWFISPAAKYRCLTCHYSAKSLFLVMMKTGYVVIFAFIYGLKKYLTVADGTST